MAKPKKTMKLKKRPVPKKKPRKNPYVVTGVHTDRGERKVDAKRRPKRRRRPV